MIYGDIELMIALGPGCLDLHLLLQLALIMWRSESPTRPTVRALAELGRVGLMQNIKSYGYSVAATSKVVCSDPIQLNPTTDPPVLLNWVDI